MQTETDPRRFVVDLDAVLPRLDEMLPAGGRLERESVTVETTYADTAERALLRQHVTLGRTVEQDGSWWELSMPDGSAGTEVMREAADNHGAVPPARLSDLLAGLSFGEAVATFAVVTTRRTAQRLTAADGGLLVEVVDDSARAVVPGGSVPGSQWREVGLRAGRVGGVLAADVGDGIAAAGGSETRPGEGLPRALGEPITDASTRDDAASLLLAYITQQCEAICVGDVKLRRGVDAVHPTRVATRRLRSLIRVFAALFDGPAARALDAHLSWYAALLGGVRERQVLRARFATLAGSPAADDAFRAGLTHLDDRLMAREREASDQLMGALSSGRYLGLLRTLLRWRTAPPFQPEASLEATALARHVRSAARSADKRLSTATAAPGDPDGLHRARKAAKRARYAAEVARPVLGEGAARKALDHYKAVQEALGEHQDSVDAVRVLSRLRAEAGAQADPSLGSPYDDLLAREKQAAEQALARALVLAR